MTSANTASLQPSYPRLFSPLTLRGITLRNRIVSTAHSTGLSDVHLIGDRLLAYYEARARGGAGLIIAGTTSVHPTSTSRLASGLSNWDDGVIAPYRRLSEMAHSFGTRVFVQLNHAGSVSGSSGGVGRTVAPSPLDPEVNVETPHELEEDEIADIVAAFARAAMRCREGRIDGIEIHAGHGNLIQQFLSPRSNVRQDGYGGSAEARVRFGLEVVHAVRQAVGSDYVVGLRLSVEEEDQGGLTLDNIRPAVAALIAAGRLDYLNVTSGTDATTRSLPHHYGPMYLPRLHMRGLARAMKAAVALPVLVVGRIVEPGAAEDLIRSGDADLVGMTRALIADPELPAKARSGRTAEIRHCVGANEGCLGRLFRGLHVSCIQSPESGRERELRPLVNAEQRRFVVVVGGGPAGLEAARLAGLRGHQVVLLERESTLGGQVNIARRAPGREELGGVTDQLAAAVARLGIEVRLGCEVTASSVLELKPDAVIVATGSAPRLPALADEDGRLVSAHAALAGARLGQKVVVLDAKGDLTGPTTADFLARRRHDVTFVTPLRAPGLRIEAMTWRILYERLLEAGMTFLADTDVVALSETGIVVRHVVSGREHTIADVVNVVAACGGRAETDLYRELRRRAPALELQLIGDAAQPRQIEQAIYEGHMAGRTI